MVTALEDRLRGVVADVMDPEIRVVTIEDLGILRGVDVAWDGRVTVTITPTYTGCPAMDVIRADIAAAVHGAGYADVEVETVLSPAWTTDRITDQGRARLAAAGIAPPSPVRAHTPVLLTLAGRRPGADAPACPRCGSADTTELSRFGSTACKSLWRCQACTEPFDHVKAY